MIPFIRGKIGKFFSHPQKFLLTPSRGQAPPIGNHCFRSMFLSGIGSDFYFKKQDWNQSLKYHRSLIFGMAYFDLL